MTPHSNATLRTEGQIKKKRSQALALYICPDILAAQIDYWNTKSQCRHHSQWCQKVNAHARAHTHTQTRTHTHTHTHIYIYIYYQVANSFKCKAVDHIVKVKVKFSLEQAMKAQTWSRAIALTFLKKRRLIRGWVVNATARPLYPGKETRCLLCRKLGATQGRFGRVPKISPPPGIAVFFSSIIALTPNGSCWVVPVMHSVNDIINEAPLLSQLFAAAGGGIISLTTPQLIILPNNLTFT